MNDDEIKSWLKILKEMSENVKEAIDESRKDPNLTKITKMGADGTPTHKIDEYAENTAIEVLERYNKSILLISEEIGEIKLGSGKTEAVIVMDPLDGTSNALKNIPCYGISIAVAEVKDENKIYDLTLDDIEIAFVENFPTGDVYTAIKGKGALKNGEPMKISNVTKLRKATVSSYIYRGEKRTIKKICTSVKRMRIMGSIAIELCYVAEGIFDAFLESRKIVRILDIAAGQLIIKENNGVVSDRFGNNLNKKLYLNSKTSIIASANKQLEENIEKLIN